MKKPQNKGVKISLKKGLKESILKTIKDMLHNECFDAVLMPMQVPAKDSYAWVLIKDKKILEEANPIAPVMPVQGAKALSSFSRKGETSLNIAALMKPCEIRAAIELSKLNQINLRNITLISYDCPGALPLSDYTDNPDNSEKKFKTIIDKLNFHDDSVKPVCQMCDEFSLIPDCDLHFGFSHNQENFMLLIPQSKRGEQIIKTMDMKASQDVSEWNKFIQEKRKKRQNKRNERFKKLKNMVEGFDTLMDTFSDCIGCHNCRSACPVCYCRQCYFDSETVIPDSDVLLLKAKKRGGISFPLDRIMFHVGRMSHMSLSCVSCGLCSDACPVSIPVAEIFSYVADNTQKDFEYKSGENKEESVPLMTFRLEEVKGIKKLVENAEG